MEQYSDNDSDICLSELNSRNCITGINDEPNLDHERVRSEQRFNMKNQIGELPSLVRTLTEKFSPGIKEENDRNALTHS